MPRPEKAPVSVGKLLLSFLAVPATLVLMSYAPGAWKFAVAGLALAALGYAAAVYGYDSRDGRDW